MNYFKLCKVLTLAILFQSASILSPAASTANISGKNYRSFNDYRVLETSLDKAYTQRLELGETLLQKPFLQIEGEESWTTVRDTFCVEGADKIEQLIVQELAQIEKDRVLSHKWTKADYSKIEFIRAYIPSAFLPANYFDSLDVAKTASKIAFGLNSAKEYVKNNPKKITAALGAVALTYAAVKNRQQIGSALTNACNSAANAYNSFDSKSMMEKMKFNVNAARAQVSVNGKALKDRLSNNPNAVKAFAMAQEFNTKLANNTKALVNRFAKTANSIDTQAVKAKVNFLKPY